MIAGRFRGQNQPEKFYVHPNDYNCQLTIIGQWPVLLGKMVADTTCLKLVNCIKALLTLNRLTESLTSGLLTQNITKYSYLR